MSTYDLINLAGVINKTKELATSTRAIRLVVEIPFYQYKENLEVFSTRKEEANLQLSLQLRKQGVITIPGLLFQASQKQEIKALIARDVFKFVLYNFKVYKSRIFNFRLAKKVKGKSINLLYKKSQLVI